MALPAASPSEHRHQLRNIAAEDDLALAPVEHGRERLGAPSADVFKTATRAQGLLHVRLGEHVRNVECGRDRQPDFEVLSARQREPAPDLGQDRWRERVPAHRRRRVSRHEQVEPAVQAVRAVNRSPRREVVDDQ
jgi:hypothetical protein